MMKNKTYHIHLKTLSPVSIGDGEAISPLADYIYDAENELIHFLDKGKFEKLFERSKELINEYTNDVYKASEKDKSDFLINFFNKYEIDYKDYILKGKSINAYLRGNATEIHSVIKTNDLPYVPGSSIKGAIRTALVYNWLKNNQKIYGRESDLQFLKKTVLYKNSKEIQNVYNRIEDNIFGSIRDKIHRNDAANIICGDTNTLQINALVVLECLRFNLKDNKKVLTTLRECISEKVDCSFKLTIDTDFRNKWLNFLCEDNLNELFRMINDFSKSLITYEIETHKSNRTYFSDENESDNIIDFYKTVLLNEITNDSCIVPIGFGKTIYQNSICFLLIKDQEIHDSFRSKFKLQPGQHLFPKTRNISETESHLAPLGWVKLGVGN